MLFRKIRMKIRYSSFVLKIRGRMVLRDTLKKLKALSPAPQIFLTLDSLDIGVFLHKSPSRG